MRRLAALLLLLFTIPVVADTTMFVRRAAPGGGGGLLVDDDFSTSAVGTEWLQQTGCSSCGTGWSISGGALTSPVQGLVLYQDALSSDDGHACLKSETVGSKYPGVLFRSASNAESRHYVVRVSSSTAIVWRHCTGASCTDMSCGGGSCSSTNTVEAANYLGVQWSGTGASTVVDWWEFTSECPADIADWDSGAAASGGWTCDSGCQSQITSNTTLDGGASYRHFGLYTGNSNSTTFDHVLVWED